MFGHEMFVNMVGPCDFLSVHELFVTGNFRVWGDSRTFGPLPLQRDNDYEIVIVALQKQIAKAARNWFYDSPSKQNGEIANIIGA